MIIRKLFLLFTFVLFSGIIAAGDVWVDYSTIGKYDNYKVEIEPHDDFTFRVELPKGAVVSRLYYFKTSPQAKSKHRLIDVGINEYEGKAYAPDAFCASDARYVSLQNYYIKGGAILLTNAFATKEMIRQ